MKIKSFHFSYFVFLGFRIVCHKKYEEITIKEILNSDWKSFGNQWFTIIYLNVFV